MSDEANLPDLDRVKAQFAILDEYRRTILEGLCWDDIIQQAGVTRELVQACSLAVRKAIGIKDLLDKMEVPTQASEEMLATAILELWSIGVLIGHKAARAIPTPPEGSVQ